MTDLLLLVFNLLISMTNADDLSWLKVEGRYIKNSKGEIVILRGVSIPDPEHLNLKKWDRPGVDASYLINKAVKEYGAKVIRIPVLPETDGKTGFFLNEKRYFENHLKPAVDLCKKLGVYVIIDLHYEKNFLDVKDNVFKFWNYVAPKFKDYSNVLFEIFNEPINPANWKIWRDQLAQPLVTRIREMAPNTPLIVGGPLWNTEVTDSVQHPIEGQNIIYSLHIYPNQWKRFDCEKRYGDMVRKYPVFMTEWGFDASSSDKKLVGNSSKYGEPILEWMKNNEMSWTVWSFDNRWSPAMFERNWTLKKGEKGMGHLVKKHLTNEKAIER